MSQKPVSRVSNLFLSSSGRIGRRAFWAAAVVLVGLLAALEYGAPHGVGRLLTAWLVKSALFFSGACVLSKRLHDRGRAGWWATLPLIAFCLAWPRPHGVSGALAMLVLAWTAGELGALPGRPSWNRNGPPAGEHRARSPPPSSPGV